MGGMAAATATAQDTAPDGRFVAKLSNRWRRSRDYTLEVFRRRPDEHLHFRPSEDVWTFAQQLTHIADASFLMAGPLRGEEREYVGAPRDLGAAELLPHLETSFEYVLAALEPLRDSEVDDLPDFMGTSVPRWELVYRILDHVAHHRGQAVVYLRLKGIQPPPYPG
jgi:uncharacterized damage-inducible protein DinB